MGDEIQREEGKQIPVTTIQAAHGTYIIHGGGGEPLHEPEEAGVFSSSHYTHLQPCLHLPLYSGFNPLPGLNPDCNPPLEVNPDWPHLHSR